MDKFYFVGFFLYLLIIVNAKVCEVNSDCNPEEKCANGFCACDDGKISSSDGSSCVDVSLGIGSKCEEDIQCLASIPGPSFCTKDLLCGCLPGYTYVNDKCVETKGYKEVCSKDTDCFDGINFNALSCVNGTCDCSTGYYLRGESDCRLSGLSTGKCFFDIDCESPENCCEFKYGPTGVCVSKLDPNHACSGLPKPNVKNYETHKPIPLNKIDISCTSNADCTKIGNAFCLTTRNKCACKTGFIYNEYNNTCFHALGSPCVDDNDCLIMHSKCNDNKICTCEDYFVNGNYSNKCFKPARGINMSCSKDENCYSLGIYGTCHKNNCGCKLNSEYNKELLLCEPVNSPETGGCEDNCETKPHSSCVNNKCKCEENYMSKNNKCLPDLGYECSEEENDCIITNAKCSNKKCECVDGYLKLDKRICIKKIDENDEKCQADLQCTAYLGPGGVCLNGNCTCLPEFDKMNIMEKDQCVLKRRFGDQCSVKAHCNTIQENAHVVCRNSKCVCDYNYILIEDEKGQRCTITGGSSILLISNLLIWSIACILIAFN